MVPASTASGVGCRVADKTVRGTERGLIWAWSADALEAQALAYLAVRSLNDLPITFPKSTGPPQPFDGDVVACPWIVCYDPQLPLQECRTKTRAELPIVIGDFFAFANGASRNDVTIVPMGVGIVGVVHVVVVIAGKQNLAVHAVSVVPDVVPRGLGQFGELGG